MDNQSKYQFTKEGFENLKKELENLIKRRPQVVINLSNAREQGDLSENAGYHAAKDELSQIDSRVREVKYLIRLGKVVDGPEGDTVSFGSTVSVEVNGSKMDFKIVEEFEANPAKGMVSTSSAIGSAILGKKVGDAVEAQTPGGKIKLKVTKLA